jgi:hypothetical protein
MYIEFHDHLGRPQRVQVTRVVVFDKNGTPLGLGVNYGEQNGVEQNFVSTAGNEDFNALLQHLGLNITTFVTDVPQVPIFRRT